MPDAEVGDGVVGLAFVLPDEGKGVHFYNFEASFSFMPRYSPKVLEEIIELDYMFTFTNKF